MPIIQMTGVVITIKDFANLDPPRMQTKMFRVINASIVMYLFALIAANIMAL
jgi:hypothetical protein